MSSGQRDRGTVVFRLRGRVGGRERVFALGLGENRLGSHGDNDLVLPSRGVSRHHALLAVSDSALEIRDLESRNGTFVGKRRVREATLDEGDVLGLGPLELKVERTEVADVELGIRLGDRPQATAADPAPQEPPTETVRAMGSSTELLAVVEELAEGLASRGPNAALEVLVEALGERCGALIDRRSPEPEVLAATGPLPRDGFVDEVLGILADEVGPCREAPAIGHGRSLGEDRFTWVCGRSPRGDERVLMIYGPPVHQPGSLQLLRVFWRLAAGCEGLAGGPVPTGRPAGSPAPGRLSFPEDYEPGKSRVMEELHEQVGLVAETDIPVVIEGETGVGKEQVARILHRSSDRAEGPLVAINCAAIPRDLLEAELFGVAQGAASGVSARDGRFRAASGGILFLDEIGELPLELQAKLLRVLQEKEVVPVGGRPEPVDVRLVTATNANLRQLVEAGRFRADLFFRVAGVVLEVPPLRARSEDVPQLVGRLLKHVVSETGKEIRGVTVQALEHLCVYPWPGNVRELMHELRRVVHACPPGEAIDSRLLAPRIRTPEETVVWEEELLSAGAPAGRDPLELKLRVERLERTLIRRALSETEGNRSEAARRLGISRGGLALKMKRFWPEEEG